MHVTLSSVISHDPIHFKACTATQRGATPSRFAPYSDMSTRYSSNRLHGSRTSSVQIAAGRSNRGGNAGLDEFSSRYRGLGKINQLFSRGNMVTVATSGDYGKPRPALVIQSNHFDQHASITLLPITSDLRDTPLFRITVYLSSDNGLRKPSQIMVDKSLTASPHTNWQRYRYPWRRNHALCRSGIDGVSGNCSVTRLILSV